MFSFTINLFSFLFGNFLFGNLNLVQVTWVINLLINDV